MSTMLQPEAVSLERLEEYVALYQDDFRRRDQARWAAVYLQGLLRPGTRKNIESLAAQVSLPPALAVSDTAQALQNFINQSPWDEQRLWQRYRSLVAPLALTTEPVLVIADITIPKQGQHSVGVQRQYSPTWGRKLNCQIAVSLHFAGPSTVSPLALRLYLPRNWLRDPERLDAAGVPEELRRPRSKGEIALELLDRVRSEGLRSTTVLASPSYGASPEFREGLADRQYAYREESPEEWLNAAGEATAPRSPDQEAARAVAENCRRICEDLGLEHFEGRSWRGFHHHACLVTLAHGFTLWQASPPGIS
jgi:SRSO17 transposase